MSPTPPLHCRSNWPLSDYRKQSAINTVGKQGNKPEPRQPNFTVGPYSKSNPQKKDWYGDKDMEGEALNRGWQYPRTAPFIVFEVFEVPLGRPHQVGVLVSVLLTDPADECPKRIVQAFIPRVELCWTQVRSNKLGHSARKWDKEIL